MTNSHALYLRRRRMVVSDLGGKCQACGARERLEIHHPNFDGEHGVGGWAQLLDVEKRLDSGEPLALLCMKCHKAVHAAHDAGKTS